MIRECAAIRVNSGSGLHFRAPLFRPKTTRGVAFGCTPGSIFAMSSPLITLFKEQLENESRTLADDLGLTKRGDFLSWWYFRRLLGLEDPEVAEILCDGGGDLGIDAIRIDEEQLVHFYQFKNPEGIDNALPAGEVDKMIAGLLTILNRRHDTIANPELRGRVQEIYQTVPTGYRIHLVTSASGITLESREKLDGFIGSLNAPDGFFVWDCEDVHSLQDQLYQKTLPTVGDPIEFSLNDGPGPYPVRSANHDCWLFHARGTVLADLYAKHGEQLLQQNIRVYQGDRGTNAAIFATCTTDDSANFLHFNNGVTFLGDEAPWDPFTKKLTIKRGQVVNGGQTVRVLHMAHTQGKLRSEVLVPIRIITSHGDKDFASNVAVNLNNQNRIEPSFLRSNDPRVLQLASSLASSGWYLERREREVALLSPAERLSIEGRIGRKLDGAVIPLKVGAQAYVATFMRQPELAKKNPKRIFLGATDGGSFEKVFSPDLTAERFVDAHRLAVCVDGLIRQFMTKKRRKERVADWKTDYADLLGGKLISQYGDAVDQVVPQSAVFLCALAYEYAVRIKQRAFEELLSELEGGGVGIFQTLLFTILVYASSDKATKSWPTLLKSQPFFENVASYLRGVAAGSIDSAAGGVAVQGQSSLFEAPDSY